MFPISLDFLDFSGLPAVELQKQLYLLSVSLFMCIYVCLGFYVGQYVEYGGTLTEMLKPRGQTGLEAKILASAS